MLTSFNRRASEMSGALRRDDLFSERRKPPAELAEVLTQIVKNREQRKATTVSQPGLSGVSPPHAVKELN
ncbi:ornithine aminomutase [Anopheles sinensis]|uniref:Ornithine aminomutase n=1 Tax=Anopheles sinensis TaxID=74873 RepID=A0A084W4R1_ANOSI|nr:ornithine aminomutase [Anopheles sinensis]